MHIAYSIFRTEEKEQDANLSLARYSGYQAACQKHNETIAAIQRYLPDWLPPFHPVINTKNN